MAVRSLPKRTLVSDSQFVKALPGRAVTPSSMMISVRESRQRFHVTVVTAPVPERVRVVPS